MYFYQYLPFSSRVAHVIQAVTDKHEEAVRETIGRKTGVAPSAVPAEAVKAYMQRPEEQTGGRAAAAKKVGAIKQQTETSLPSAHFDTAAFDPIRSEDLWSCVGAWQVGRVLDTKAAVHERYAGGPREHGVLVHRRRAGCVARGVARADHPRHQGAQHRVPARPE